MANSFSPYSYHHEIAVIQFHITHLDYKTWHFSCLQSFCHVFQTHAIVHCKRLFSITAICHCYQSRKKLYQHILCSLKLSSSYCHRQYCILPWPSETTSFLASSCYSCAFTMPVTYLSSLCTSSCASLNWHAGPSTCASSTCSRSTLTSSALLYLTTSSSSTGC